MKDRLEITIASGSGDMEIQNRSEKEIKIICLDTSEPAYFHFGFEDGKIFLEVNKEGEFIFNKKEFPEWDIHDYVREFINLVEKVTKKGHNE